MSWKVDGVRQGLGTAASTGAPRPSRCGRHRAIPHAVTPTTRTPIPTTASAPLATPTSSATRSCGASGPSGAAGRDCNCNCRPRRAAWPA